VYVRCEYVGLISEKLSHGMNNVTGARRDNLTCTFNVTFYCYEVSVSVKMPLIREIWSAHSGVILQSVIMCWLVNRHRRFERSHCLHFQSRNPTTLDYSTVTIKVKQSLQAWTGPEGSKRLRLTDFPYFKTVSTWRL